MCSTTDIDNDLELTESSKHCRYLTPNNDDSNHLYTTTKQQQQQQQENSQSINVINWQAWYNEIQNQCRTAIPTLIGVILYKIPWLISLRFVGGMDRIELAAAALASTLCNVTGISLSVGLSSAITTLTSQSRGDLLLRHNNKLLLLQQQNVVASKICCDVDVEATDDDDENDEEENDESDTNQKRQFDEIEREVLLRPLNSHRTAPDYEIIIKSKKSYSNNNNDDDLLLPMVYLIRGLFIQVLFVVPVGIWWLYGIQSILIYLGQGIELSRMTEQYLRILTPGLWSYGINWTLTAWLQALEMAYVPAYAAIFGLVFHIPCNYFFIYVCNFGYLGCAIATVTFQLLQPIIILTYLFGTHRGRCQVLQQTYAHVVNKQSIFDGWWLELKEAIQNRHGIIQYLGLAIPGIIVISEWWASEIVIFLSGRLLPSPDVAVGSMTLYQSINTFCFMFPVAFSVSGSTRVGNLLGANQPRMAQFAGIVSVSCAGIVSCIIGLLLYIVPHTYIPSLFAPSHQDVINETSKVIPLLALYVVGDGLTTAWNGIIKGCGRQAISMPVVIIAYWIVALPLAYYLTFIQQDGQMVCSSPKAICGVVALVLAMTIGTWVDMILRAAVVITCTDWQHEAQKAKERLQRKIVR